jgi:hypothetical protein
MTEGMLSGQSRCFYACFYVALAIFWGEKKKLLSANQLHQIALVQYLFKV